MFERFIVATDVSPATYAIVNCLGGLQAYGAQQCLLLQCISMREGASMAYSYQTEKVKSGLEEQKRILEAHGFFVEARTVVGSAKTEVTRIAKKEDYALIIVGAQGQTLLAEKVLGGVAFGILGKSEKPVLVVPIERMPGDSDACQPIDRCDFQKHVLFATDFSDASDHAFTYLQQMVSHGVRQITLLHVQEQNRIFGDLEAKLDEFNRIDRERLALLESRLKEVAPVEVAIECPYGFAKKEISKMADQSDASLVLMGTQGRGFFGEFFLGSVAADTARRSNVPTLLVPPLRSPRLRIALD